MWKQVEYTSEIPSASGCYAIYCSGLIAYIGHSKNIKRRIFEHLSANHFREMTIKILLNESKYHEGRLINRIKPALNLRVKYQAFEMRFKHMGIKNYFYLSVNNHKAIWEKKDNMVMCINPEESGRNYPQSKATTNRKEKDGAQCGRVTPNAYGSRLLCSALPLSCGRGSAIRRLSGGCSASPRGDSHESPGR
jgi:hypothetical protein